MVGNMKETTFNWYKIFYLFYREVLKWTFLMYIVCLLIIIVFEVLRSNPISYIIGFFICFGICFFRVFFKKETRREFYENN